MENDVWYLNLFGYEKEGKNLTKKGPPCPRSIGRSLRRLSNEMCRKRENGWGILRSLGDRWRKREFRGRRRANCTDHWSKRTGYKRTESWSSWSRKTRLACRNNMLIWDSGTRQLRSCTTFIRQKPRIHGKQRPIWWSCWGIRSYWFPWEFRWTRLTWIKMRAFDSEERYSLYCTRELYMSKLLLVWQFTREPV